MKNMDINTYLKRLEEESSDSKREDDLEAIAEAIEELATIHICLQSIIEFGKYKLRVKKISTNICKPKDKR